MEKTNGLEILAEETTIKTFKRFYSFVSINEKTECWEWTGCKNTDSYGLFKFKRKMLRSHRFSYAFFNGPIPDGMMILHMCDNPKCCNPDHLFLGTNSDNQIDCMAKNRGNRSTLTTDDIIRIKRLLNFGIRQAAIADMYQVSETTISRIKHNKRWGYVKPQEELN